MGLKPNGDLKSGSVMDILGKPSEPSGGGFGGVQPASQLKTGSVMDFLSPKTTDKKEAGSGAFTAASELKKGSVMDVLGKGATFCVTSHKILFLIRPQLRLLEKYIVYP